jgi:hypothetical protein
MTIETYPVFIAHNEFGYANPEAISTSANSVTFDIDKISKDLKSKIYGKTEIMQLTKDEMQQISDAGTIVRRVGAKMMSNIFNK